MFVCENTEKRNCMKMKIREQVIMILLITVDLTLSLFIDIFADS